MAQRVRTLGRGEPYAEPLFCTYAPKVRWLQDSSGGNRGLSRGPGAIGVTSRQSTRLHVNGGTVSIRSSG